MNQRILSFLAFLLFSNLLVAQVGWERLYPVDMSIEHLTIDGTDFEDGYLKLALTTERDSAIYKNANITKLDIKGDVLWSRNLVVEDSLELRREGDLHVMGNGNIAIALAGLKDSLSQNIIVTDNAGNVVWSKSYAIYMDSLDFPLVKPRLAESAIDSNLYYADIGVEMGEARIFVSKVSRDDGQSIWSNYIDIEGSELIFGDITACAEGGVMISGVNNTTGEFFISKIAEDGSLVYNKSVLGNLDPTESFVNSIIQLQDSSYVLAGSQFTQNVEYDGIIIHLDTLGDVNWSKRVDFDFSINDVTLLDLVEGRDGDILISAKQVGALDTAAFGMQLDLAGNVVWQSLYKETALEDIQLGGLGRSALGGMSYFLTGGNEEDEQYIAYLITSDSTGMTICNDSIDMQIVFDASFQSDTLELTSASFDANYILECCDEFSRLYLNSNSAFVSKTKIFGDNQYLLNHNLDAGGFRPYLTKFDASNTPIWRRALNINGRITDFIETDSGEIILIARSLDSGQNFIAKLDADGLLLESKAFDAPLDEIINRISKHDAALDTDFPYYISGSRSVDVGGDNVAQSFLMNLDEDLNINWTNYYNLDNNGVATAFHSPLANGNVLTYGGNGNFSSGLISEINGADGTIVQSTITQEGLIFREMVQLSNGNILGVGSANVNMNGAGLIVLLDSNYDIIASYVLDNTVVTGGLREITVINDTNFYLVSKTFLVEHAIMRFEIDATNNISLEQSWIGNVDGFPDGPSLAFDNGNFFYAAKAQDDIQGEIHFSFGSSMDLVSCLTDTVLGIQEFAMTFDTLELTQFVEMFPDSVGIADIDPSEFMLLEECSTLAFAECKDVDVSSSNFAQYSVPVLMLAVMPLCPNEPIMWTFDANTDGAVSYLWMDDEGNELGTADTLTVTETGTYNVAVTMGSDVCYVLCDTATLETFEEPQLTISQNASILCETGELILVANPNAEAGVDTIFWSTNEGGNTINVNQEGTYTATLIDNCGIEVTADFEPDFDVLEEPAAIILVDTAPFCANGTIQLTAVPNGTMTPFESFLWNTNETSNPIFVSESGTYGVVVTDECGLLASAEVDIVVPNLVQTATIADGFDTYCETGNYVLTLTTAPDDAQEASIVWSTNETDVNQITVTQPGNYSAVVTDICGNEITANILVDQIPVQVGNSGVGIGQICQLDSVNIVIFEPNSTFTYQWSNGETGDNIVVENESGIYSVVVTDLCNEPLELEIDAKNCLAEIEFPNVFFPGQLNVDFNSTFGPFIKGDVDLSETEIEDILANVTDYELQVYNRWGEKVFESTDFNERWDGMYKDKEAPTDNYLFYGSYTYITTSVEFKNDVTLMR